MRILRVAQKVYHDVVGGGPYHVHALSRDQAALGHDVTVLTVATDPSLPRQEERDGYTVIRREPTATPLGNAVSAGLARYLTNVDGFDVLHAHSHLYFSTNLAALRRRLAGPPMAITNHGLYSQNAPEWAFDWYLRTVGRFTFDSADVAFCYTSTDERRLREFGVRVPIEVVPNGIDQTRFTPDGPESDLIDAPGPILLFAGRLVEGKRPADALGVLARVRDSFPEAELVFCGDGPMRGRLERAAVEAGMADAVTFLGHVDYDTMPDVYRAADVLVLPSRHEGFPRVILEAMACGTPAVTTDLEQVTEVVASTGATAPVGDRTGLAAGVERVLAADPNSTDVAAAVADYSWETTVEETTAVLERIGVDS